MSSSDAVPATDEEHQPLSAQSENQANVPDAEDSLPLQYRIRRYVHTLPFLSPSSIYIAALFFVACLHAISLLLFTRGFLLTRQALPQVNDCRTITVDGDLDASCSLPPTHSKLVLLVVDALRADFVLPVESPSNPYYSNHISLPSRLHSQRPTHSFLSHFIADAPTTTLQRLKGLTTGSLPTFVDVSSNFAGEAVVEDNWLSQAKRAGKRLAMVGDDTWLNVFPRETKESVWAANKTWPFDSFNVEDLDTVDRGVKTHLLELLDRSDSWDFLVAHNLGLDHAGHRFGAKHGEATRKLRETQELLEEVIDKLDENTLLVVIGDHGMTDRGDHGGDSRDEIDAALWIYSKDVPLVDQRWFKEAVTSPKHQLASLFSSSRHSVELGDSLTLSWPEKGLTTPARSVAQVDLVPTLSLLLGLPVPFGNLGLPIPELFYRESKLPVAPTPGENPIQRNPKRSLFGRTAAVDVKAGRALEKLSPLSTLLQAHVIVASQLSHYLEVYTSRSSGFELIKSLPELHFTLGIAKSAFRGAHAPGQSREEMEKKAIEKFWQYGRKAREKARRIWARFDPILMMGGLLLWAGSLLVAARLIAAARQGVAARFLLGHGLEGAILAIWATTSIALLRGFSFLGGLKPLGALFLVGLGAEMSIISAPKSHASISESFNLPTLRGPFKITQLASQFGPLLPLAAHAAIFASNSFTVFEDSMVLFLLSTLLLISLARAFAAPETRLRKRLVGFNLLALGCVRLMAYSKVCREEQGATCHMTFHQVPGSVGALAVVGLAYVAAWLAPTILRRFLALSASDVALAPAYLGYLVRAALVSAVSYWAADWAIAGMNLDTNGMVIATSVKTAFARIVIVGVVLMASLIWYYTPLCLRIQREGVTDSKGNVVKTQIKFIGFANALGSSYLLFYAAIYALVCLVNPPTGQLVLTLQLVVILCLLEIFDSERDVQHLHALVSSSASLDALLSGGDPLGAPSAPAHNGPTFVQVSILALLAHVSYFATGHQAAFNTIQWSTAFIGFPRLLYPFSPFLVALNTLGASHVLIPLSIPLFVFWNLSPALKDQPALVVPRNLLRAGAAYISYQAAVALSSAAFAAFFRRHLMVWKIFAPRFMLAGISVLATDVVMVVLAMAWGARGVLGKAKATLGTRFKE